MSGSVVDSFLFVSAGLWTEQQPAKKEREQFSPLRAKQANIIRMAFLNLLKALIVRPCGTAHERNGALACAVSEKPYKPSFFNSVFTDNKKTLLFQTFFGVHILILRTMRSVMVFFPGNLLIDAIICASAFRLSCKFLALE